MSASAGIKHTGRKTRFFEKSWFLNVSNILMLVTIITVYWLLEKVIQPDLHFQAQQFEFNTGFNFLKPFLSDPGGISNYLALFVAQFFALNTLGSLLITLVVVLQGFMFLKILDGLYKKNRYRYFIFSLITVFGIVLFCNYEYPFQASIKLMFAYIFVWVFVKTNHQNWLVIILFWLVLSVLLFYLASGAALIVFGLSSLIILIIRNQKKWMKYSPFFVLFSGFLPLITYKFISPLSPYHLYSITELLPPEEISSSTLYILYAYYLLLPVILLAVKLFSRKKYFKKAKNRKGFKFLKSNKSSGKVELNLVFQVITIVVITCLLFEVSFNDSKKKMLQIEYHAEKQNWQEVLNCAEKIDEYNLLVNFQVNRAYANLGQLPNRLFNYPQLYGSIGLFIDKSEHSGSFTFQLSDFYFDLGLMSESLRWAYEAQTLMPFSPRVLKRLIIIYLVNEQYELAEKFLNVLDKNLLNRKWVSKYRRYVKNTSLADSDNVIAEKRKFNPQYKTVNSDPVINLKLLLYANRDNKLAYEYFLSLLILDVNNNEFIGNLRDYRRYNFTNLPKSWEEALCLYAYRNELPDFINANIITKQCTENFKVFNSVMSNYNGNRMKAQSALQKDFGDTYWYYLLFIKPQVDNEDNV